MSSDSDSNGKLWMRSHTQSSNPSTSSGTSQLHHVTPIRHPRLMSMPFPPQSVRIIPANPDTTGPPIRPSPPSPLENRPLGNPVCHSPFESPLKRFLPIQSILQDGPDTSFDSSSPIFGSDSNRMDVSKTPTDSPMEWASITPPARVPLQRAHVIYTAPPTPNCGPPTPGAAPFSPFVPPPQPPAPYFSSNTPYNIPTPHTYAPYDGGPPPQSAPTPPPNVGIQPRIVVTPPQEPTVEGARTPNTVPMPSENEGANRPPLFNDPPNVTVLNSPPHISPPLGALAHIPAEVLEEYKRALRARIVNRPQTPRPSAWGMDIEEVDDSPVAPSHRSSNDSPLALTHASMEIDDLFRDTNLDDSLQSRHESTGIWVNSERMRSGRMLDIEGEDTLVNPPDEDVSGVIETNINPTMTSNRERRYSVPTGKLFDGQGDRLAPSAGPSRRKRELSGGSSKARPSREGTPEPEKRKRRKMKGKGKENLDLRFPTDN